MQKAYPIDKEFIELLQSMDMLHTPIIEDDKNDNPVLYLPEDPISSDPRWFLRTDPMNDATMWLLPEEPIRDDFKVTPHLEREKTMEEREIELAKEISVKGGDNRWSLPEEPMSDDYKAALLAVERERFREEMEIDLAIKLSLEACSLKFNKWYPNFGLTPIIRHSYTFLFIVFL
jgi:hypothetical protein